MAPRTSPGWRGAWGALVLLDLAALGDAVAGSSGLGGPTAVFHGLAFALGAAFLWAPLAVVLAVAYTAPRWGSADDAALARRTAIAALALACVELGLGAAAIHFASHHRLDHALARVAAGLVAATLAAAGLALHLRRRQPPRRLRLALLALPSLVPAGLWFAAPAHLRAHDEVAVALLAAALLPWAAWVPAPRARRLPALVLGLGALCSVHLALDLGDRPGLAAALLDRRVLIREAVAVGRWLGDVDGDGSAAWFGGRDCAPFDGARGPAGAEIANNGVDDNCLLGDLQDDHAPVAAHGAAPPAALGRRPSVLVISVDALRPDRMSIHGYPRPTTPAIDRHFAAAVRFDSAYSEAASTRDTLPSLLTGRRRTELEWHARDAVVLAPGTPTLAHAFAARGYRTIAVLPFVALNMMGSAELGFATTAIYPEARPRSARDVNARVLAAIDDGDGPFFAFVHYYEPHYPYERHLEHAGVSSLPYDQEVASVDAAVGELLAGLDRRGVGPDTWVILTADHGEAFGEHGHHLHNHGVYEEDIRVPWLLRIPGLPAAVITAPVSTTALAATLHDGLGWALPAHGPPTVSSVWPLVVGATAEPEPVIAVARADLDHERFALRRGPDKLLFDRELTAFELFDVVADPAERHELSSELPARADEMLALAAHHLEHVVGAARSRRVRAAGHHQPPGGARLVADDGPRGVVAAWAEVLRPVPDAGLPVRLLVHTLVDASSADFEVVLVADGDVVQRVAGPPGPRSPEAPLHDDVRTFKVYVDDLDQRIELRQGDRRLSLGSVREQPAGRAPPPR